MLRIAGFAIQYGSRDDAPAQAKFSNNNRSIFLEDFLGLWAYTAQDFVDDKVIDPAYAAEVILQGN